MSGSSRATRSRMSSRRSSPFVNTPKDPKTAPPSSEGPRDPKKTSAETWVEPDLPQPAPSFVGDKLLRQGVLENMLPLGSLPSGRARPKARVEGAVFQSTPLRAGEEILQNEPPVTQTLAPSPHQNYIVRDSEERGTRSLKSRSRGEEDEEEDDDEYRPTAVRRPSLFGSKMATTSTPTSAPQFSTPLIRPDIVQKASLQLRTEGRAHVADALEQAFSASQSDPNVTAIFDAILSNEPSGQHSRAFKRLIKGFSGSTGKKSRRRLENVQSTRPADSVSPTTRKSQRQSTPQPIGSPSMRPSSNHVNANLNQSLKPNPIDNSESITVDSVTFVNRGTASINGYGSHHIKGSSPPADSSSRPPHLHIPYPRPLPSSIISPSLHSPTHHDVAIMSEAALPHERSASPGPSNVAEAESSAAGTKKRARSSSTSSLSSLDSRINDLAHGVDNGDLNPGGSGADVATEAEGSSSSQPPAKRRKSLGPKVGAATKRAAKPKGRSGAALEKENESKKLRDRLDALRAEFQRMANVNAGNFPPDYDQHIPESNVRGAPPSKKHQQSSIAQNGSASVVAPDSLKIPSSVDQPSRSETPTVAGPSLPNGQSRKRSRDDTNGDVDEPSIFPNGVELLSNARPATPKIPPRPVQHPAQRARRGGPARIVISPYKRGGFPAVTAGVPRGVEETEASGGNGASGSAQENNDTCSACSGSGRLLCCDGCIRSWHFACCDPPIQEGNSPTGEWFCESCYPKPPPPASASRLRNGSSFAILLTVLDKEPPIAFALPSEYRDYFEGVKTGVDGEYEATNNGRILNTVLKKRKLEKDEGPAWDNLKLRDENGELIQCHGCQKFADGVREITYCDYCPAKWHLDCLNPPLAFDPHRPKITDPDALPDDPEVVKKKYSERVGVKCQLHVDHDLALTGNTGRGYSFHNPEYVARYNAGEHLRMPKARYPKQHKIVDPTIQRGHRNNGLIEVELMEDAYQIDQINDIELNGTVFRVPEKGIRLDFLDRLARDHQANRVLKARAVIVAQKAEERAAAETAKNLAGRPIVEQQAALNLAQLQNPNAEFTLNGNQLEGLCNALIAQAPPEVIQSLGDSHAVNLDSRDTLLALRELINAKLGQVPSSGIVETSAGVAAAAPTSDRAASPTSSGVADTSAAASKGAADTSAAAGSEEVAYQISSVRDE